MGDNTSNVRRPRGASLPTTAEIEHQGCQNQTRECRSVKLWDRLPESEAPASSLAVDAELGPFAASLTFHLVLLVMLGLAPLLGPRQPESLVLTLPTVEPEEPLTPQEFHFSDDTSAEVGANSLNGEQAALAQALELDPISEVFNFDDVIDTPHPDLDINLAVEVSTADHLTENVIVRGSAGEASTGASGAVDRITQEILLSLEERKTLVVWLFDQSGSLNRQRKLIRDRFNRIYDELGIIEAAGNEAFSKHKDTPLLSSVVAFGQTVSLMTENPTADLAQIKAAVDAITEDQSGQEQVFRAVYAAADRYRNLRRTDSETGEPIRNVLLVVFTDEAGDDYLKGLEPTIALCRRLEMPVYVVGVPAPFGRQETYVKWVDPDPGFDQTPQMAVVNQGPESLMPERVKIGFSAEPDEAIDSGFGPFALTRLCYETGGIYFAVHPNRNVNREITRRETAEFSAHISHFFDQHVMRRYRPDYVSIEEYQRRLKSNLARESLVAASKATWITQMDSPQLRFVKQEEAAFVSALTEAQKVAAKLEPQIAVIYDVLKRGEAEREKEASPRWQAGYDLAMGRVAAAKVRVESYNAMLALAKRGMVFQQECNNTWTLDPSDEISVGSQLEKIADKARMYLTRVVEDHPGTPWALLAQRELNEPLGWKWVESFTDLNPPRPAANNNNNNNNPLPRNDQARMLDRKPKRSPPRL